MRGWAHLVQELAGIVLFTPNFQKMDDALSRIRMGPRSSFRRTDKVLCRLRDSEIAGRRLPEIPQPKPSLLMAPFWKVTGSSNGAASGVTEIQGVNRRPIGTPDRHPIGTPS